MGPQQQPSRDPNTVPYWTCWHFPFRHCFVYCFEQIKSSPIRSDPGGSCLRAKIARAGKLHYKMKANYFSNLVLLALVLLVAVNGALFNWTPLPAGSEDDVIEIDLSPMVKAVKKAGVDLSRAALSVTARGKPVCPKANFEDAFCSFGLTEAALGTPKDASSKDQLELHIKIADKEDASDVHFEKVLVVHLSAQEDDEDVAVGGGPGGADAVAGMLRLAKLRRAKVYIIGATMVGAVGLYKLNDEFRDFVDPILVLSAPLVKRCADMCFAWKAKSLDPLVSLLLKGGSSLGSALCKCPEIVGNAAVKCHQEVGIVVMECSRAAKVCVAAAGPATMQCLQAAGSLTKQCGQAIGAATTQCGAATASAASTCLTMVSMLTQKCMQCVVKTGQGLGQVAILCATTAGTLARHCGQAAESVTASLVAATSQSLESGSHFAGSYLQTCQKGVCSSLHAGLQAGYSLGSALCKCPEIVGNAAVKCHQEVGIVVMECSRAAKVCVAAAGPATMQCLQAAGSLTKQCGQAVGSVASQVWPLVKRGSNVVGSGLQSCRERVGSSLQAAHSAFKILQEPSVSAVAPKVGRDWGRGIGGALLSLVVVAASAAFACIKRGGINFGDLFGGGVKPSAQVARERTGRRKSLRQVLLEIIHHLRRDLAVVKSTNKLGWGGREAAF